MMPAWLMPAIGLGLSLFGGKKGADASAGNQKLYNQERSRILEQSGNLSNRFNSRLDGAETRSDDAYNFASQGYKDIFGGNFFGDGNGGGGGGGGGTGPGGSGRTGNIEDFISRISSFANKPIDDEGMRRARGGGVFDEFARTGGWSDADKSNYLRKATSVIPSMFGQAGNQLSRQATVTGNTGSLGNSMTRLLREQAMAGQDAQTNAELGLHDSVSQGRQWGAGGMSQAELALQDLITRSKLGGLEAGMGGELNLMGLEDARAAAAANNSTARDSMALQARLAALGGLSDLRGQTPGEVNMYNNNLLGLFDSTNAGIARNLPGAMNDGSGFMRGFGQVGGTISPLLAALMGGNKRRSVLSSFTAE